MPGKSKKRDNGETSSRGNYQSSRRIHEELPSREAATQRLFDAHKELSDYIDEVTRKAQKAIDHKKNDEFGANIEDGPDRAQLNEELDLSLAMLDEMDNYRKNHFGQVEAYYKDALGALGHKEPEKQEEQAATPAKDKGKGKEKAAEDKGKGKETAAADKGKGKATASQLSEEEEMRQLISMIQSHFPTSQELHSVPGTVVPRQAGSRALRTQERADYRKLSGAPIMPLPSAESPASLPGSNPPQKKQKLSAAAAAATPSSSQTKKTMPLLANPTPQQGTADSTHTGPPPPPQKKVTLTLSSRTDPQKSRGQGPQAPSVKQESQHSETASVSTMPPASPPNPPVRVRFTDKNKASSSAAAAGLSSGTAGPSSAGAPPAAEKEEESEEEEEEEVAPHDRVRKRPHGGRGKKRGKRGKRGGGGGHRGSSRKAR